MAAGDLDHDGLPELLTANVTAGSVTVLENRTRSSTGPFLAPFLGRTRPGPAPLVEASRSHGAIELPASAPPAPVLLRSRP
jgi:hypothetical protein